MSTIDKYIIKASEEIQSVGRQETRVDLALDINTHSNSGSVTGTVLDENGNPIANATVKLNTANIEPYDHTNTNAQGKFIINRVPTGSYLIGAVKEGYLMPPAISLSVVKKKATDVAITLLTDTNANKNIIFGIVKSNVDGSLLEGVTVQLYEKELPEDVFMGMVTTNEYGQYFFVALDDGEYYTKSSKLGYFTTESSSINISDKQYSSLDISLLADSQANTGVICGIIFDKESGLPISNGVVALYSIEKDIENIYKITKTNIEGKYLFGNILPGTYIIKSTVQEDE